MATILVPGGAGYIGTHTVVELTNAGYDVIVVDNLFNSKEEAIKRVEKITGKKITFYKVDVLDKDAMRKIFSAHKIDAVINFAGYKAVGESCAKPIEYYHNNIGGMIALIEVMREFNCKNIVFSSSATVYGNPATVPITEDFPLSTNSPYGSTKLFIEYILKDLYKADNSFNIAILRYFNPIGAHESGLIGEDPNGIPNNLCPYITQVAIGKRPYLNVFGNDYDTPDGTCVRDYIHVVDLAIGHVQAVKKLLTNSGLFIVNLGTGKGYSVLDVIKAFSKSLGREIPYKIVARRAGDVAQCYADPSLAYKVIGFKATKTLDDMCRDSLNWQFKNPDGYGD
ncbi:MAG TPA: UDP-glucose 4-epimerase GalE [Clostridiales bacterium]|nr:UDP-glucose 4-epimerase GalE [Clostridiales bacterium]HBJ97841.1 UDP-glucose 4-epimerase GalE [Clostridiales bacterium]